MSQNIIYLNGFMGAGKSTVGPMLADVLGWEFYDLDTVIEQELGAKIKDIFSQHGEKYFRQKESEILKKLSGLKNVVISLGGGTSSHNNNHEIISRTGKIVYLKASPETLYERLKNTKDRPLFNAQKGKDTDEVKNNLLQLLIQRSPFYEQADLIINTELVSLELTVDKITQLIKKQTNEEN